MGTLANPVIFAAYDRQHTASSSPWSGTATLSPTLAIPSEHRTHRKGNSSVTSVTFTGESHWGSKASKLVSLEVASRTPSITKRGFEWMYHRSRGHHPVSSSLYFGPASGLARKSQRDSTPRGLASACHDLDTPPPLPVVFIASGPQEKRGSTIAFDVCDDSRKKLLKAAPLISLEEAKQREVSRRKHAAKIQVEHEVRGLKREVAEIARKKEQAKREERLAMERQAEEALEALERRNREGSTLTAAVAAKEDGLVLAPTDWIVPLISLDKARHIEKAKRSAVDASKPSLSLSPPPPSAVTSVDLLKVNAGDGTTATLQLVSLEEAAKRDRARRLEEDATDVIESRTRMLAHAGTGLSHVPLITLAEAHKQDTFRRENGGPQDGGKSRSLNPMSGSHKPNRPPLPSLANRMIETDSRGRRALTKDASAPQEKARWTALMSNAGNWWARPNATSDCSGPAIARPPMGISDWI